MTLGPIMPDVSVLPSPKTPEEIDMFNALRDFMLRTTDTLDFLVKPPTASITSAYTATAGDYTMLCDASTGAFTVTLPLAKPNTNKVYVIKKTDSSANAITIDGNGSETVENSLTASLSSQYDTKTIQSDGTEWWILSEN